jgi:hypothetical protein
MKKNLDISKEAVKALTLQAVRENTVFKLYAERLLETAAIPLIEAENAKNGIKTVKTLKK